MPGRVVVADGPGGPNVDPRRVAGARGVVDGELLLGWTLHDLPWLEDMGNWSASTYLPTAKLRRAVAQARVAYLPVRLAAMPALVRGPWAGDVAIVAGVPRGTGFAFATSVGYADAAAAAAREVVVEVAADRADVGGPMIPGRVVATVDSGPRKADEPSRPPDPIDRAIAALVVGALPSGATLQFGLGALPEAVLDLVQEPVSVLSGMVSDGLVRLAARGLLRGPAMTSYLYGGTELDDLAADGSVQLVGVEELHRGGRLAATARFVAINTALEVGLDGAVNIERSGTRLVAGIGGHADYCAMASQSQGGMSIIAVRSTHRGASAIVARPAVVSTPRADVHVVVTEHGVADLRGATDDQRRERLIAIADPAMRDELVAAARW